MRQEELVEIKNVKRAQSALNYLRTRPIHEMVGLGLIYGAPGLGKSRFAKRVAFQNGYIYIRLDATTTARSFLIKLYKRIMTRLNQHIDYVGGSSSYILDNIIQELSVVEMIIVVDEIDYAFHNKQLLGTIRDIVDRTFSIVLLIGMVSAKEELMKANAHYFDRCNAFVKFEALTLKEVGIYLSSVSDVKMDQDLVHHIYKKTEGNMRNIVKELRVIEALAKSKELKSVSLKDFMKVNYE